MKFYEAVTCIDQLKRIATALEQHTEVMREHTARWEESLALGRESFELNKAIFERQKAYADSIDELNRLLGKES